MSQAHQSQRLLQCPRDIDWDGGHSCTDLITTMMEAGITELCVVTEEMPEWFINLKVERYSFKKLIRAKWMDSLGNLHAVLTQNMKQRTPRNIYLSIYQFIYLFKQSLNQSRLTKPHGCFTKGVTQSNTN